MKLAGQDDASKCAVPSCSRLDDSGYILAVLLIGMAVAAVWMSALLPAWRFQAQREREAELVFRGEQWARAIALYTKKYPGTLPPNVDVLVSEKFLRKKYKDPITGEDFRFLGIAVPGQDTGVSLAQADRAGQAGNQQLGAGRGGNVQPGQMGIVSQQPTQPGLWGVRSTSTDTSIRIYLNQQEYDLWQFDYLLACQKIGCGTGNQQGGPGGAAGARAPGGRGSDAPQGGFGGLGGRGGRGVDRGGGRGGARGGGRGGVGGGVSRGGGVGGTRGGGS